jgi:AraC family transcriptional regulator, transcriptional activator of pobA
VLNIPVTQPTFRVSPLSHLARGGKWRTEAMRSYSQPVLLWFTQGQGRITISGVTRGYGAHNMVFLPAGTMHGFELQNRAFGHAVFLPVDQKELFPVEPLHLRFRDVSQQSELNILIDSIHRELDQDLPARERALEFHTGLLAVWIERQLTLMPEYDLNSDASRRLTAAFSALVENGFCSGRSISEYAADLGVTATHLSRACNAASGRPASALLADRVHFEARRLLADTRLPVQDIAAGLGFNSAAYFSRAFHRQTGVSPSDFRRNS